MANSKITKEMALEYHEYPRPGKTEIVPTKPHSTAHDLALAYSPGVAYPCLEIKENPDDIFRYTNKGNLVGVISNGTAVLGLGNIGADAGKPVMEGKALLFKIYAGLDCFDIEIDEKDPKKFVEIVKSLAPTFGGINLEDIKAPECFEIERELKKQCNIPVMHDDQHGTAIISGAGLINALEIQGKKIEDIKLVVNGAGAAAYSCTKLYMELGVRKENIIMCDSKGVLTTKRQDLNEQKKEFAVDTDITTLAEAIKDADVFLGLSVKGVLTPDMIRTMAPKPIVFALANPDPEIEYEEAMASREDIIMATGRSDYPNQINNVLGFPYIFRGALDCQATAINEDMKLAAVHAIARLAKEPVPSVVNVAYGLSHLTFGKDYILPKPMDPRLLIEVAPAVARAAAASGVSRKPIADWDEYVNSLRKRMGFDNKILRSMVETARRNPKRVVFGEGNTDNMLKAAVQAYQDGICKPILLGNEEMIEKRAKRLNLDLEGIELVNPRHDREADRRFRFARHLAEKGARKGITMPEALEKLNDRNYFGMMMVELNDADAMIAGTYSTTQIPGQIAQETVGIRPDYSHFASMHILNTKKGTYFLADTSINHSTDEETLMDIAKLARYAAEYFAHTPVMAMVSYSNFGAVDQPESKKVHNVVDRMQKLYPDLAIDGEMQIDYALNRRKRDEMFPFSRLAGKDVNTLVFPNLSAASVACKAMLEMGVGEAIGPIQMGLNKPVHFINVDSRVRDIVNLTTVASLDATVREKIMK